MQHVLTLFSLHVVGIEFCLAVLWHKRAEARKSVSTIARFIGIWWSPEGLCHRSSFTPQGHLSENSENAHTPFGICTKPIRRKNGAVWITRLAANEQTLPASPALPEHAQKIVQPYMLHRYIAMRCMNSPEQTAWS